jgi:putative transposase
MSKQLTIDQGGTNLVGLPYGGAELKPLRDRYGRSFKTECRWDPDDMSKLFIRDPEARGVWLESPCRWTAYANDLSWNQHRLIRKFNREKLNAKGAEEYLLEARMRLHEMWLDVTRPRRRKESQMAGQAAGITSARVFSGLPVADPPKMAARIVVAEDAVEGSLIPELESFDME